MKSLFSVYSEEKNFCRGEEGAVVLEEDRGWVWLFFPVWESVTSVSSQVRHMLMKARGAVWGCDESSPDGWRNFLHQHVFVVWTSFSCWASLWYLKTEHVLHWAVEHSTVGALDPSLSHCRLRVTGGGIGVRCVGYEWLDTKGMLWAPPISSLKSMAGDCLQDNMGSGCLIVGPSGADSHGSFLEGGLFSVFLILDTILFTLWSCFPVLYFISRRTLTFSSESTLWTLCCLWAEFSLAGTHTFGSSQ